MVKTGMPRTTTRMTPRGQRIACVVLLGLLAAALTGCAARGGDPPNVLFIVVDTLRKDALGCYGQSRSTSPHIDALAQAGLRYENAFSQAPWTTPSIGSMLTSLYPTELGIQAEPNLLGEEFVLLPEVLQAAGYQTGAAISHMFVGRKWNFDQGFEWFNDENESDLDAISSPGISDAAISFLEQRDPQRPFFLFLHYYDPHYNYLEHDEFVFSEALDYDGPVRPGMDYFTLFYRMKLSERDREYLVRVYDSEVAFVDFHIGRVLRQLKETGLFDDTLIVFTADHGEEFGDHNSYGHTKTLYNELINVPLLIKYDGDSPTGTVHQTVGLIDLFPTLLEYLRIPVAHRISGRSFLKRSESLPVFSETSRWAELRAVVSDGRKVIWDLQRARHALFDLRNDGKERRNVMQQQPEMLEAMKRSLAEWVRDSTAAVPQDVELTEEEKERLRSLGYLNY